MAMALSDEWSYHQTIKAFASEAEPPFESAEQQRVKPRQCLIASRPLGTERGQPLPRFVIPEQRVRRHDHSADASSDHAW